MNLRSLSQRRNDMVRIYVRKILAGQMTLEQVPERWREQVREALGE